MPYIHIRFYWVISLIIAAIIQMSSLLYTVVQNNFKTKIIKNKSTILVANHTFLFGMVDRQADEQQRELPYGDGL